MKFIKGNIPWNKGKKGVMPEPWNKGKTDVYSKETLKKIGIAKKGIKASKETKRKMSLAHKGKPNLGAFKKGQPSWNKGKSCSGEAKKKISEANKGKKHSEETKRKMSEAAKGGNSGSFKKGQISWNKGKKGYHAGSKHYNWQGGKSFEPYGLGFNKTLKEQIRKRDNYICQECGWTQKQLGYKLPVHHIDYNKQNNKPENLISLCRACHTQTNYGREDWTNYFNQKQA